MHPTEILIVRSVSLQHLDLVLPGIAAAFPGRRLVLLSHPHSVAAAGKYPQLAEVVAYPHKGPFQPWHRVPALAGRRFEAVIVPVSSLSGGGFFNVFAFAFTLRASRRLVCAAQGDLRALSTGRLLWQASARALAALSALLATLLLVLPALVLLPAWLAWLGGRKV